MNVIVGCEVSGVVREAFRKKGHTVTSVDLEESLDNSPYHVRGDLLEYLRDHAAETDLLIAHPPCTYLANSGVHWLYKDPMRWEKMERDAIFFRTIMEQDIPMIAVENPVMHHFAKDIIGKNYTQTIQPYQFGHPESKRTCLWLKDLPELKATNEMEKPAKGYWDNQTPSGQNKIGPRKDRQLLRAITYVGIAEAMADQWGD